MGTLKDVLDSVEKVISEHGSAAILREHLALMKAQAELIERENTKLQGDLADAKAAIRTLTRELQAKARAEEFIEHHGVLFKRKTTGGYEKLPYCPSCKLGMSSLEGVLPYSCSRCDFHADFNGAGLFAIMANIGE